MHGFELMGVIMLKVSEIEIMQAGEKIKKYMMYFSSVETVNLHTIDLVKILFSCSKIY